MASFLELCLDTADPSSDIATFWAAVSGCRTTRAKSGGPADVVGDHVQHGISICPVDEPKTVKNRVHLDIYARSVDDLTALGAVVELPADESGFGWTVMRDPEGNEFCAFAPRDEQGELPAYRVHGIVVGTVEEFLDRGATHLWDRPSWSVLADPEGNEFCVFPEPK